MAMLGFKRRFEPMIRDGRKRHTIRGKRKIPVNVGETLHCYVDPRQKTMSLLGRWRCTRVQDIQIGFGRVRSVTGVIGELNVTVDGISLTAGECELLARSDGFDTFSEMMEFWRGRLPFSGDLIHWDYTGIAPESPKPASTRPANNKRKTTPR